MNKTYSAEKLDCTVDEKGSIVSININGKEFTGFPGLLETYGNADAQAVWSNDGDALKCIIRLTGKNNTNHEAGFRFRVPYHRLQYSMTAWVAREGFPKNICDLGGNAFAYGDVCFGAALPLVSLYIPEEKTGLTVARIPGRTGGRLSFRFDDYHAEGMYIEYSNLEVRPEESVDFTFLFKAHGGDWRPGLKWYADRYPEYFEPPNQDVWKYRSFMMTNPFVKPESLDEFTPDWAEVHNHFPIYGNYFPQEKSWQSIIAHDYPDDAAGRDLSCSADLIKKHLADLKEKNIKSLMYIQCGGDASIPWVEKNFPSDISRDSADNIYPTWKNCCFANYDEKTPAGKFLHKQFDRLLELYPETDGVFVDQLCYQTFDFCNSDGKSMKNGRKVYEYGKSLEDNFVKLAKKIHSLNKLVLVNGPFDMDVAKEADAMMSEGVSNIFETYRYMCIRKPMLIHEFPFDAYNTEMMLRNCLLTAAGWSYGGTPSCEKPMNWSSDIRELYQLYLPLVNELFGSKILLTENPLDWFPKQIAGAEIFQSPEQNKIFVSILGADSFHFKNAKFTIRAGREIEKIQIMKTGSTVWSDISFSQKDDDVTVELNINFPAALLKIIAKE
ncbi:MAG: hypothetical protein IKB71_04795 [Lentisphaeria bacterium]|nr:hypothetical protein [Lentisphaeria bacterium]